MDTIIILVLAVFGVLQIILFFKIWEMTNDVKKIRKMTNLRNRLTFFNQLPEKCKKRDGEVYYVRGLFEDKIYYSNKKDDDYPLELDSDLAYFVEE